MPDGATSDPYADLLGEGESSNPLEAVVNYARRYKAIRSGAMLQAAHMKFQMRAHEQDSLIKMLSDAANRGQPIGPEATKYAKSIGLDPQVVEFLGAHAQGVQQQQAQMQRQLQQAFGLTPEELAGAGGGGTGGDPPGAGPAAGQGPAPTSFANAGPNAGKHWSDPSFDWQHFTQNEPPELKQIDRQLRLAAYQLAVADMQGRPTAGLKAAVDSLKAQHHELMSGYLGLTKQASQQEFSREQQARSQGFSQAQQGRAEGFSEAQQARQFQHQEALQSLKAGSPQDQVAAANEQYSELVAEKEDIAAGLNNGTLTEAQAVAKLATVRAKVAKLDAAETKAKRAPQGPKLGLLEARVGHTPTSLHGLIGGKPEVTEGTGAAPPVPGAKHGVSKTKGPGWMTPDGKFIPDKK
jgi:hypothetical protein